MEQEQPAAHAELVNRLGKVIADMKGAGLDAAEVALVLQSRAKTRGMNITIGVQKIGPITALDMSPDYEQAKVLLGDPVVSEPIGQCAGPHLACPACGAKEALCMRTELLASVGKTREDLPPDGACPHCGSFLVMVRSTEPWTFRLMTEEETFALSDDDRNRLLRQRRRAEQRRSPT